MGVSGGGGGGGSASQGYGYVQGLQQQLQKSLQQSSGKQGSSQQIWGPQAQALQGMYGGAQGLMNSQAAAMPGIAQGQNDAVMGQARAGLNQMQQFANPNSGLAQQQLADYSQQVGQNFNREIMPGIRSGAGVTGNRGGSRAALAQGVAGGDAARAIAQGGTDIYSHQYDTAAQAAAQLPGMASQVYNLGMAPQAAAWAPYTSAAGIFGGPTTLSSSFGNTSSFGSSFGMSQGQNVGENWNSQMGNPTKPSYGFQLF